MLHGWLPQLNLGLPVWAAVATNAAQLLTFGVAHTYLASTAWKDLAGRAGLSKRLIAAL